MKRTEVIRIAHRVFNEVKEYYGLSKFQSFEPYLVIENSPYADEKADGWGEYRAWDNELILYWTELKTTESIIRTVVHEYQHYLQSPSWYTRYANKFTYDENPYELQAYSEENNWENFL